jgi:uncharacterized Fe-S cluster protein YjdI
MTNESPGQQTRSLSDTRKEYRLGTLAVSFDSALCIHTGKCLQGSPGVFNLRQRPWIQLDKDAEDRIVETVNRCPSGALQWQTADSHLDDSVKAESPLIYVSEDGPLLIRGSIELDGGDGEVLIESPRLALCRCGQSANKPFCDNTHREAGWKATT